jgi:hypothetical protein
MGAKSSSKRARIETAIEHRAQRGVIDPFEPGNVTNNLDVSIMLYCAPILRVFFSNHDDTMQDNPGTTKDRESEQCVINRPQRRARRHNDGRAYMTHQIQHERFVIDWNQNATGTFDDEWNRGYGPSNTLHIDCDALLVSRQVGRDRSIENI